MIFVRLVEPLCAMCKKLILLRRMSVTLSCPSSSCLLFNVGTWSMAADEKVARLINEGTHSCDQRNMKNGVNTIGTLFGILCWVWSSIPCPNLTTTSFLSSQSLKLYVCFHEYFQVAIFAIIGRSSVFLSNPQRTPASQYVDTYPRYRTGVPRGIPR